MHPHCHTEIIALLWEVVFSPDIPLNNVHKAYLLKALRTRLSKQSLRWSPHNARMDATFKIRAQVSRETYSTAPTIRDLCSFLIDALFSPPKGTKHIPQAFTDWSTTISRAIFAFHPSDNITISTQWDCLLALGLVSEPASKSLERKAGTLSHLCLDSDVTDWQTVCSLRWFDMVLHSVGNKDDTTNFRPILETLWKRWSDSPSSLAAPSKVRPKEVLRVICKTIFSLAGRVQSRSVAEACHRYCAASDLYEPKQDTSLLAEQLTAFALSGVHISAAFIIAKDNISGPNSNSEFSAAVSAAISLCSRYRPEVAHELQILARRTGVNVTTAATTDLGIALAKADLGTFAVECLVDPRLSRRQQLQILHPILLIFVRHGRERLPDTFIRQVGNVMLELYEAVSPAVKIRRSLQYAILVMARSRHELRAVRLVEAILKHTTTTTFFQSSWFWTFLLRALLDHRQFRLAGRIYELAAKVQPRYALMWQRMLLIRYSRGGAWNVASRLSSCADLRVWRSATHTLARHVQFRESAPARVLALRIPSIVKSFPNAVDGAPGRYATLLLVRAGRLRVAKKMYEEATDEVTRTTMGNNILHGSMMHRSRRNVRQMKKVLETLKELVGTGGFVPDRVTVNILMKSLLRWRKDVDGSQLRALFDRMVRSGYPTASSAGEPPFGTNAQWPMGKSMRVGSLIKTTEEISYGRHVRPLYRMFIKAFYMRGDVYAARKVVGILKAVEETQAIDRDGEQGSGRRQRRSRREGSAIDLVST